MRPHLEALARVPRPAGGVDSLVAQEYCAAQLRALGFTVTSRAFEFSALPGRWAATIIGVMGMAFASTVTLDGRYGLDAALITIAIVVSTGFLGSQWATRLPVLRESGVNLEASRGENPHVWLVAHIDTKSQPVSTAMRTFGVIMLAIGTTIAPWQFLIDRYQSGFTVIPVASVCAGVGGLILFSSIVRSSSSGAADNASGVAAVLEAAELVRPEVSFGVLITDAEELALGGAYAWVRGRTPGIAINCDTIDDEGAYRVMRYGTSPGLIAAAAKVSRDEQLPLRMTSPLPGVLTDSVAFHANDWETVTLCRGNLRTLSRIHTKRDGLSELSGEGIADAARVLGGLVEELSLE